MNVYNVDDYNKIKCNVNNISNYSGILNCSKYDSKNVVINYSLEYLNGKPIDINPKIYEFNNLEFANAIYKKSFDYENINNCFTVDNYDTCHDKKLYGSSEVINLNNNNYLNYCAENNICTDKYKYNNSYFFKKKCFGNNCSYNINCECNKLKE